MFVYLDNAKVTPRTGNVTKTAKHTNIERKK